MQEWKEQEKCCDVETDPDKIWILLRFVDPDRVQDSQETATNKGKRMKFLVFKISLEDRRLQ
jgi:hypothetical protein